MLAYEDRLVPAGRLPPESECAWRTKDQLPGNIAFLKRPPIDHESFNRLDCEADEAWPEKAIEIIRRGGKTVLANCNLSGLDAISEECRLHNYVLLILRYPNQPLWVRAYIRPERRKAPRLRSVDADDDF